MKIKLMYRHQTQGAATLSKSVNFSSFNKTATVGSPGALTMQPYLFSVISFLCMCPESSTACLSSEKSLALQNPQYDP